MANTSREPTAPQVASVETEVEPAVKSDRERIKQHLAKQRKVNIRIPKDRGSGWAQINGYTFDIAAGFDVEVPEQIAELLRDGGYI